MKISCLIVSLFLINNLLSQTQTYYNIPNGQMTIIDEWNECRKVTNNTGNAIFIPTKTSAEWLSFINFYPTGIILDPCGPGCNSVVFEDHFNGSTLAGFIGNPFGDPHVCAYPNTTYSANNGSEQYVRLNCYDEGELRYSNLSLPADDYVINVAWRTGVDGFEYSKADHTNLDDQYGASITIPNRLIVIDGVLIDQHIGQESNYSEVTSINFTGSINNLYLVTGTAGSPNYYYTYYDSLVVRKVCQ